MQAPDGSEAYTRNGELRLTPVIDTVFPLEEFEKGLEQLESRRVFGKIIVAP